MRDRFDYETYWWILARITATHQCLRLRELAVDDPPELFFVLRHDVDYSPESALRLAEQEAANSLRATYLLLLDTSYYNLLAPEHSCVPRRLVELGHEVGLHYDVRSFAPYPRKQWGRLLRAQIWLLAELAGQSVVSIAMHQPALHGEDPFRREKGLLNASDPRSVRDAVYISDSCRAWRDSAWSMLEKNDLPPRLQLNLHPINWADEDRDRVAIFRGLHEELAARVLREGEDLLAKIAAHAGVREHERRR